MDLHNQFKNKSIVELNDLQEDRLWQLQKSMFQKQILMCDDGVDADQLPNGYGEFGLSLTNPIPCQSILGGRLYLDRLRTVDGAKIMYQRTGLFFTEVTKHPVDGYEVSKHNGKPLATLYISAYQKRNSTIAPINFVLVDNPFN